MRAGRGTFGLAEWRPRGIDAHVSDINADTRKQLREMVLNMPPDRFEALIRELLIRMGFRVQSRSPRIAGMAALTSLASTAPPD